MPRIIPEPRYLSIPSIELGAEVLERDDARLRRVRVIRDYGKYDRREAPQYFPSVADTSGETE
jgi:hypothetical protein